MNTTKSISSLGNNNAYPYGSISEWAGSQRTTRRAVDIAGFGIPVFSCKQDKAPDTAHGFKDATTDPARLAGMFRKPGLLIGMPTGLPSNIDVIDEDPRNGGSLDTIGPMPMDVVARSRSGGRHVFTKHRPGNRSGKLADGIDLKSDGGYVILWGYSDSGDWISGGLTSELPPYPEHVRRGGTKMRATGLDTAAIRNGVRAGERNDLIFRGLCQYRHFNRPIDEAKAWAADAAMNSDPPYTEADTGEMAERVYFKYAPGDFPEPHRFETPDRISGLVEQRFHHTDLGNADRFDYLFGDRYLYVHAWNRFMVWNGKRWTPDERGELGRLAEQVVRAMYREAADTDDSAERKLLVKHAKSSEAHHRIQAMLERVKTRRTATPDDFDKDPMLLNCQNGTLDLRTGTLRDHDRADLITKIVPVNYDPDAAAPTFEKFLSDILPAEPVRDFVRRLVGYALNGETSEKALPILFGPGGDNGKSTLLNAVMEMFGDYGLQASNDLLLGQSSHPTEVADLFGRRFVTNVETDEGRRLRESLVKQLTGGDRISARRMRENPWNFWPTHTIFMATNHRPEIRGTDNAIWNRIKLIPFTVSIPKEQQDRELSAKLRAELPGILAWAVRGHSEWLENRLQEPAEVRAATNDYRAEMDVLASFLADECVIDPNLIVKASKLYGRYKLWCEESGERPVSQRAFGSRMTERGFARKRVSAGNVYIDLGLPEDRGDDVPMYDRVPFAGITQTDEKSHEVNPKKGTQGTQGTRLTEVARVLEEEGYDHIACMEAHELREAATQVADYLSEWTSLGYRPDEETVIEAARLLKRAPA